MLTSVAREHLFCQLLHVGISTQIWYCDLFFPEASTLFYRFQYVLGGEI